MFWNFFLVPSPSLRALKKQPIILVVPILSIERNWSEIAVWWDNLSPYRSNWPFFFLGGSSPWRKKTKLSFPCRIFPFIGIVLDSVAQDSWHDSFKMLKLCEHHVGYLQLRAIFRIELKQVRIGHRRNCNNLSINIAHGWRSDFYFTPNRRNLLSSRISRTSPHYHKRGDTRKRNRSVLWPERKQIKWKIQF